MSAALPLFAGLVHAPEARPSSPAVASPSLQTSPAASTTAAGAFADMGALHARLLGALPRLRISSHLSCRSIAACLATGATPRRDGETMMLEWLDGRRMWTTAAGIAVVLAEVEA